MSMINEQVKELREIAHSLELFPIHDFTGTAKTIKRAADTIESLSAKLQAENMERSAEDCGGWIPCKEKLPEKEQYYIVTIINWGKKSTIEYCLFQNRKWYLVADGSYEENTSWKEEIESVIAWRELPEPYHEP